MTDRVRAILFCHCEESLSSGATKQSQYGLTKRDSLEKLNKRIQQIKGKRVGYGDILDFYQKVKEEQEKIKTSLKLESIHIKKEWKELLTKEGFPILERKDFPVDIEASSTLFHSLCNIAKDANPHMVEQVRKIGEAIDNKKINPKELLKEGTKEQKVEQIANKFGLDKKVLLFLVQSSIRPSIEKGMKQLVKELDTENWLKGFCPICGSFPQLSLLKEEVGKRFLLCSYCGCEWRIERLYCPFCSNKDQDSLYYFYAEREETYRIDLCEKCHQYIKTIDLRKIEELDPFLEDIATLHLDILASQKGYKRPVPNLWTT
jgi:FdhE protein